MSNDRLSALAAALRRFWYPKCYVCGQHKPSFVAYSTTCGDCMPRPVTNLEASADGDSVYEVVDIRFKEA